MNEREHEQREQEMTKKNSTRDMKKLSPYEKTYLYGERDEYKRIECIREKETKAKTCT